MVQFTLPKNSKIGARQDLAASGESEIGARIPRLPLEP